MPMCCDTCDDEALIWLCLLVMNVDNHVIVDWCIWSWWDNVYFVYECNERYLYVIILEVHFV